MQPKETLAHVRKDVHTKERVEILKYLSIRNAQTNYGYSHRMEHYAAVRKNEADLYFTDMEKVPVYLIIILKSKYRTTHNLVPFRLKNVSGDLCVHIWVCVGVCALTSAHVYMCGKVIWKDTPQATGHDPCRWGSGTWGRPQGSTHICSTYVIAWIFCSKKVETRRTFFFWPHPTAWGILGPWPGIKPVPPAVGAQSPNYWTTREFPEELFFNSRDDHVSPLFVH